MIDFVTVFEDVESCGGSVGRILGFLLARNAEAASHEGGLAGSGDTGEDGEASGGDLNVKVLEIIDRAPLELDPAFAGTDRGDLAAFAA